LANARVLIDDFQFDKALALLGELAKEPGLDQPTLINLFELEGIARATKGDATGARAAFAKLLTLDPAHPIPGELPPKVRTLYFGARTVAQREALELTANEPTFADGHLDQLSVQVKNSALVPAKSVRFTVSIDGAAATSTVVPLAAEPRVTLAVKGAQVKWSAELLGANEAVLRRVERDDAAPVPVVSPTPPPPPPPAVTATPGDWQKPTGIVLGAGGLVAVGVGVALGVQASDARAKLANATTDANGVVTGVTQAQAAQLDATARSGALAANVLMVAGGVAAVGGALLFLLAPPPASGPAVSFSFGPGGVVAAGRF
jgi:hypothetical protein